MAGTENSKNAWTRLVLGALPSPAWLNDPAPAGEVALSSRCRFLRNLRGFRFPHTAHTDELIEVQARLLGAFDAMGKNYNVQRSLTEVERNYLVGCRFVSPDFPWHDVGRSFLLDQRRIVAALINEEDHLRLQALTPGLSIESAISEATECLDALGKKCEFARTDAHGYLAASPINAGIGRRLSAMFHLIGLAEQGRLPQVMTALGEQGLAVRGLFGETSRAVGAFVQMSSIHASDQKFNGACEYLVEEELAARANLTRSAIEDQAHSALTFTAAKRKLTLAEALRILAWIRLDSCTSFGAPAIPFRKVDLLLTSLELRAGETSDAAAEARSEFLRKALLI